MSIDQDGFNFSYGCHRRVNARHLKRLHNREITDITENKLLEMVEQFSKNGRPFIKCVNVENDKPPVTGPVNPDVRRPTDQLQSGVI